MSLLQKASIITTPTAYAEDFLYNIKPAGGLGDELVTNGTFDTDSNWNKSATFTISNGKLHCLSDGSYQYANQANVFVVGRTYKLTFEVVDYTSGVIRVRPSGQSSFITASANGTYTFFYTATNTTLVIERHNVACNLFVDNVSVKEVLDFDFDRNSTGTRVNEDYLIETLATNTPRIDYTNGEPSILLEPSRTNLIGNNSTANGISSATITNNYAISPEGLQNSIRVVTTGAGNNSGVLYSINNTSTTDTITYSIYVKGEKGKTVNIRFETTPYSLQSQENFLLDGTWQKYTKTIDYTGAPTHTFKQFYLTSISSATATDFQIYGAQAEVGSYATSLIHTSGSTVTRSADVATNAGNSDLINNVEGTLYVEAKAINNIATNFDRLATLSDGASGDSNVVRLEVNPTTQDRINWAVRVGGSTLASGNITGNDITQQNKYALSYKSGDTKFFVNGRLISTSTSTFTLPTLDRLNLSNAVGTNGLLGNAKSVMVFKEALTDLELEKLTGYNNHELYMNYYNRLSYLGTAEEYNVESDINNYIL
jgi:hypothetical protein